LNGAQKTIGFVLLIVGIVVLIVSVRGDAIGFGGFPGFAHKQMAGTSVGACGDYGSDPDTPKMKTLKYTAGRREVSFLPAADSG
jgi:hypothetical protein